MLLTFLNCVFKGLYSFFSGDYGKLKDNDDDNHDEKKNKNEVDTYCIDIKDSYHEKLTDNFA